MLLNLSDVLSDQHSPIDAAVPLEINTMKLPGGSYPLEERSNVQIHVEHVKGKEIAVSGNCSLTAVIPCDRCLSPVRVPMEISFEKRAIVGGELRRQTKHQIILTDIILTSTNYSIMRF